MDIHIKNLLWQNSVLAGHFVNEGMGWYGGRLNSSIELWGTLRIRTWAGRKLRKEEILLWQTRMQERTPLNSLEQRL